MASVSAGLSVFTDLSLRIREFTLTTYNNLPNTLFIASLLMGAIQGNMPMIWVSLGFLVNGMVTVTLQELLCLLFPTWNQVLQPSSTMCSMIHEFTLKDQKTNVAVAPSMWFSATTYFVVFILYNAIQVAIRPAAEGADPQKVDTRIAFSLSVIMLSIFFFALLLLRGFTGCETWLGSILGILVGSSIGIGYWHILDICHSGIPPDILNVVSSTAPAAKRDIVPVVCTA
jgi:hypothetical protein